MTYRSLLVLLDQDPLRGARTQAAIRLAKAFDAHLSGLAPTGLIDLPGSPTAAASLAEFAALAWSDLRERAHQAAGAFRHACEAAGLTHTDALVDEDDCAPSLRRHAHAHDLIIMSQADPGKLWHTRTQHLVEQAVLFSGRPTLVLPYTGSFDMAFGTALVAWDDSREAARALSDALPFLHRAKRVHVVAWKESGFVEANTRPAPLDGVATWLRKHGVSAELRTEATSNRIADAMLSLASDLEADLIVMGAYGHARWAERMLGGATRGLLNTMTVPVLMSH